MADMRPVRVLIVEDNPDDTDLAKVYVERTGIDTIVDSVDDGEKAVQMFEKPESGSNGIPDLVLLDIHVPKRNGLEVLNTIRLKNAGTTVIVYSGSNSPDEISKAKSSGADGYLLKPMSAEDMKNTVGELKKMLKKVQDRISSEP